MEVQAVPYRHDPSFLSALWQFTQRSPALAIPALWSLPELPLLRETEAQRGEEHCPNGQTASLGRSQGKTPFIHLFHIIHQDPTTRVVRFSR